MRELTIGLHDFWINDGEWTIADVVNEQPTLDANLICCKPDPRGGIHRLDHPIDQGRDLAVNLSDLRGSAVEDRVTIGANRGNAHPTILPGEFSRSTQDQCLRRNDPWDEVPPQAHRRESRASPIAARPRHH